MHNKLSINIAYKIVDYSLIITLIFQRNLKAKIPQKIMETKKL